MNTPPVMKGFDTYFGIPFSNDMWRYHPNMSVRDNEDKLIREIRARADYTGVAGRPYPANGGFQNDLPLMRDRRTIESNPDQRQLTTRFTAAALEFIAAKRDQPFFILPQCPVGLV